MIARGARQIGSCVTVTRVLVHPLAFFETVLGRDRVSCRGGQNFVRTGESARAGTRVHECFGLVREDSSVKSKI